MIWKNREREVGEESGGAMAFAFGRATPSLRQAPLMCLDNPVLGNIIFSLNGEHHLLLKVLHFRVDKRRERNELKEEILVLLDFLVEKGSVIGYMLRERVI